MEQKAVTLWSLFTGGGSSGSIHHRRRPISQTQAGYIPWGGLVEDVDQLPHPNALEGSENLSSSSPSNSPCSSSPGMAAIWVHSMVRSSTRHSMKEGPGGALQSPARTRWGRHGRRNEKSTSGGRRITAGLHSGVAFFFSHLKKNN